MLDITQTQAQRFHGPKQMALFCELDNSKNPNTKGFNKNHDKNDPKQRKLSNPQNIAKNPHSTWRGNIYKCTSILEYSRSIGMNERRNPQQTFPAMVVRSTFIPYVVSPPGRQGNILPGEYRTRVLEEYCKQKSTPKESEPAITTLPPVVASKQKDFENEFGVKYKMGQMILGGSQTPEKRKRINIQKQLNSALKPINELLEGNFQLQIQKAPIVQYQPKIHPPIQEYSQNSLNSLMKRPSQRARSSTAAKKEQNKSNTADSERKNSKENPSHIRSQENILKLTDIKRKTTTGPTKPLDGKQKRYSHSPNNSLHTIKEKPISENKDHNDSLNKSIGNTVDNGAQPLRKKQKNRPRPVKKEEPPAPIMPERLKQKSKPVFFADDPYTFVIMPGNNSQIIKRVLEKRYDWKEAPGFCSIYNFKWQPFSKGLRFDQISLSQKQMINHFENHHEVTTKDCLFKNLLTYVEHKRGNVFDYVPLTFLLDVDSETYALDYEKIIHCYNIIEGFKKNTDYDQCVKLINQKLVNFPIFKDKKTQTHCKAKLHKTHYSGNNIWILKPTGFNRGRGVEVFDSLEKLRSLVKYYSEGVIENVAAVESNPIPVSKAEIDPLLDSEAARTSLTNINNLPSIIKSRQFVIQKYIERPLLIHDRKFDIRVWVLITQEMKLYFFKEGYIRTSCEKYTTSSDAIDKRNIHLTNNAVQKYAEHFGEFEDANQLSFPQFQVFFLNNI